MITRFHIENFKSLANFDLPPRGHQLGLFTCLIGLNGAGKSTLLQALDFAAHIVTGQVKEWLNQRNWKRNEIITNFGKWTPVVTIKIDFSQDGVEASWQARYNVQQSRCTYEKVESEKNTLLELSAEKLSLAGPKGQWIRKDDNWGGILYNGSVLSMLDLAEAHPTLTRVKDTLSHLKSLELLSPELLRRRAAAARDIGIGGEKLSAFLASLTLDQRNGLLQELRKYYPHLSHWRVKTLRAGWKDLSFEEDYQGGGHIQAAHINDGLLRIMAILAQAYSPYTFLLFDEIENGINPELVEQLVNFLIGWGKQVLVTTHSPMILNYIPDEVAIENIVMLYKTRQGETRSVRFFDMPGMRNKLEALGPGEVFVDTSLTQLAGELEQQDFETPSIAERL